MILQQLFSKTAFRCKIQVVTLRSYALAIETSRYETFESFFTRLERIVELSAELIESDFFTRVGLRYINYVPIEDHELNGWINPALVGPIINGTFGTIQQFFYGVSGYTRSGKYNFRHGINPQGEAMTGYLLDFDFYNENIAFENALTLAKDFNELSYWLFHWSLGEKAIRYLGKGKAKMETR